jgi:hypothetical protein
MDWLDDFLDWVVDNADIACIALIAIIIAVWLVAR